MTTQEIFKFVFLPYPGLAFLLSMVWYVFMRQKDFNSMSGVLMIQLCGIEGLLYMATVYRPHQNDFLIPYFLEAYVIGAAGMVVGAVYFMVTEVRRH